MSETKMPAAEANSYELAFHILPTVAEGEVANVFQNLKDIITKAGGSIVTEETPARFDLAYDIVKYLEGRNRKFNSAYFGWVRFSAEPAVIEEVSEAVDGVKELLRHLLIKLTKVEEENPFLFHEALEEQKVETVDVSEEETPEKESETDEVKEVEEEKATESEADGEEVKDKV